MIVKIEGMQIAYYEGTYFGVCGKECGKEFIVTNQIDFIGLIFNLVDIEKAEQNPATMAEIQSMGFTFGLHYPLKGG